MELSWKMIKMVINDKMVKKGKLIILHNQQGI